MIPDPDRPGYFLAVVHRALSDVIRGYTDADIAAATRKLEIAKKAGPGQLTLFTHDELATMHGEGLS